MLALFPPSFASHLLLFPHFLFSDSPDVLNPIYLPSSASSNNCNDPPNFSRYAQSLLSSFSQTNAHICTFLLSTDLLSLLLHLIILPAKTVYWMSNGGHNSPSHSQTTIQWNTAEKRTLLYRTSTPFLSSSFLLPE